MQHGLFVSAVVRSLCVLARCRESRFVAACCSHRALWLQVYMPYACKLLFQEMMSMCIVPRLRFDEPQYKRAQE